MSSNAALRSVVKLLGGSEGDSMEEEIIGHWSQVAMLLLFVFLIACELFVSAAERRAAQLERELKKTKTALGDAIEENKTARKEVEEILSRESKDKSEIDSERKEALFDLQKEKLITALAEVEKEEERIVGLDMFSETNNTGIVNYDVEGVLVNDKITDNMLVRGRFIDGSKEAKARARDPRGMKKAWFNTVLSKAGIKDEDLEEENRTWLIREILTRSKSLINRVKEMQSEVLRKVLRYYRTNPEKLDDQDSRKLTEAYRNASDERDKGRLMMELFNRICQYARLVIERQGVSLLTE